MKIGILTLPLHTNYGGILQAFALQSFLKQQGHDVWLIKRTWNINYITRIKIFVKHFIKKYILFQKYDANKFIHRHIKQTTQKYFTSETLQKYVKNKHFDAFIVGSDQIWRPKFAGDILYDYFLHFINDQVIKKIAYAASFGEDEWSFSKEQTTICSKLLQQFNAVSVREKSGIMLCKNNMGVIAKHVLDPTMLLGKKNYLLLTKNIKVNGNLFVYNILGSIQENEKIVSIVMKKEHLIPFRMTVNKNNVSVERWLKSFDVAKFVVTDSFHACIFSIIFNKPFIVFTNNVEGRTRFVSLLSEFGLENRLIQSSEQTESVLNTYIDWSFVNLVLKTKQMESLQFLQNALI